MPDSSSSRGGIAARKAAEPTQEPEISKATPAPKSIESGPTVGWETQQAILSTFQRAFEERFNSDLRETIQALKGHLYNRDFEQAFGNESLLDIYALRWGPTRAVAYLDLLLSLPQIHESLSPGLEGVSEHFQDDDLDVGSRELAVDGLRQDRLGRGSISSKPGTIVSLGAGSGAELAAFAWMKRNLENSTCSMSLRILDVAGWGAVLQKLNGELERPMQMSFIQLDLLSMPKNRIQKTFRDARLVTLMFTLNELYSTSLAKTTSFLLSIALAVSGGALLLVVDSPGSYSTVKLGKGSKQKGTEREEKRYPMHWLLEHTLMTPSADGNVQWDRLHSAESRWLRLARGLQYPIDLEDMRYQAHLYRRR